MPNKPGILLLAPYLLLTACATAPSQKGDFVVYGEEPEGPGLISGDSGEFVLFKQDGRQADAADDSARPGGQPQPLSAEEWQEFEAFKRWLEARETDSNSYQEFLQWRQFEAYKQWQESTGE